MTARAPAEITRAEPRATAMGGPLVSRVHGQKSGGKPVVPCVRPGPFGE